MNKKLRISGTALCLLLFAATGWATTVVKMELPQLVLESDSIVQGRVEQVYAQWDANVKLIFTYVSVRVDDPLKGGPRQNILIRQLGGKVGAMNMAIAGTPKFKTGDEVIVFLKDNPEGTYHVIGLNQGKYEILDNFAIANVSGVELFDARTRRIIDGGMVDRQPLETFKSRIRGMLK